MDPLAIVLLNHNGKHLLARFLPSVVQHSHPHRIVVVDNASEDDSMHFIQQSYPQVQYIQLSSNEGFARGYNLALKEIKASYYVLLNTDIEVTAGWIPPIIQLMDQNPAIGACQPKILSYQHKNKFEYAGAGGGFIDSLGHPFCRGRLFDTLEEDKGQYDDVREVFWASGACFFMRASAFQDLRGFDEQFFAYYEEIDLCWRMQRQGFQVYYCGQSHVYHVGSATMGATNPYKTYLNFRNRALTLYKNTPAPVHPWKQWLRVILDLGAAVKELVLGRSRHCWAILRAQVDFFRLKSSYKPPQQLGTVNNIYQGLIPFTYFMKRKRKFSALNKAKF